MQCLFSNASATVDEPLSASPRHCRLLLPLVWQVCRWEGQILCTLTQLMLPLPATVCLIPDSLDDTEIRAAGLLPLVLHTYQVPVDPDQPCRGLLSLHAELLLPRRDPVPDFLVGDATAAAAFLQQLLASDAPRKVANIVGVLAVPVYQVMPGQSAQQALAACKSSINPPWCSPKALAGAGTAVSCRQTAQSPSCTQIQA